MIEIIFATHSTSLDNERRLASGHADTPLSPLGQRQAESLGERYRDAPIAAVFCSDLQRSFRTAELAFADRDIPIIRDARLRECDYGVFTRQPSKVVDGERPKRLTEPFPAGESYVQVAARVRSLLQEMVEPYTGQRIMIIGHRATQYALEHWLNGIPLEEAVVAPFQWQPGWTYRLVGVPAPS
ncbi:MAG: histidine phosphatase family protein [Dehalococcoidia bacterium]|nr:histidine phosphatase family protein [Dehalococcoidia bacterium]